MGPLTTEALKAILFVIPGLVSLRVKAALSISAPRWAEVLTKAPQGYAVVACKDGSRFLGWVDTFSEEAGNYEIFLSRASQVQEDGSLLAIPGPGVLLTRENPIVRVELWNPVEGGSLASKGDDNVRDEDNRS